MTIYAVANQKGGSGKSTLSVHLAYWLMMNQQQKVILVDGDAQRSSSQWVAGMEDVQIPYQVLQSPDDLLEKIPELADQYEQIVVDSPGSLSESTRAILFRADIALIPVQPSGVDLKSGFDAIRLVKQAQSVRGGKPKAALLLSRAVKGTKLKQEAIEVLSQISDAQLLKSVIHQKQAIADTSGQSAVVWQLQSKGAVDAGKEYERLFQEVMKL